jgi:hypothetical protein
MAPDNGKVESLYLGELDCLAVFPRSAENFVPGLAQEVDCALEKHDLLWGQNVKPDSQAGMV